MKISRKLLASASLLLINSNCFYAAQECFISQPSFLVRRVLFNKSSLYINDQNNLYKYNGLTAVRQYSGSNDKNYPGDENLNGDNHPRRGQIDRRASWNQMKQLESKIKDSEDLWQEMMTLVKQDMKNLRKFLEPQYSQDDPEKNFKQLKSPPPYLKETKPGFYEKSPSSGSFFHAEKHNYPIDCSHFSSKEKNPQTSSPFLSREASSRLEKQNYPIGSDSFYPRKTRPESQHIEISRDNSFRSEKQILPKESHGFYPHEIQDNFQESISEDGYSFKTEERKSTKSRSSSSSYNARKP